MKTMCWRYSDLYIVDGEYVRVRVPSRIGRTFFTYCFEPTIASIDYEIRNIQAIKENESELYCSGQQAQSGSTNAFLDGIDSESDSGSDIHSEDVCKQLYGEDAWLGFSMEAAHKLKKSTLHVVVIDRTNITWVRLKI